MRSLPLIARELRHRPGHAVASLLALVLTVALPVVFHGAGAAAQRETSRIQRDLGYNLRIIPGDASLEHFWDRGYADTTMDQELVRNFQSRGDLSYRHLIATLQRRIQWRGQPALLTGIAEELSPQGRKKPSMSFVVKPGTVHLGHAIARREQLQKRSQIALEGRSFEVAAVLSEQGSRDDIRIWMALPDAQALLEEPGRINEIKALECYCQNPELDTLAKLRRELEDVLPGAQVLRLEKMAAAREKQRRMSEEYFALLLPFVLGLSALWVAFLALLNVRERRAEIGTLRALGHGAGRIGALFLGRAALLGILAAGLGFALGSWALLQFGPEVFEVTAGKIETEWMLLLIAIPTAPLFACVASLAPAMHAVAQDPADVLREDT